FHTRLEKALAYVIAFCPVTSLSMQRHLKVLDAKLEVIRRQLDLYKALDIGDPEKIYKRKDKLAVSRNEMQEAQTGLVGVQPHD
ncbi:DUF1090 family protein, partial [Pseudomonas syringae pv. tagetis]|uniref:DUF1090 family protein n=1 Tax=Pseudomonas syringae group genomosp. 7 TaxID=251699 RepID=UPI00376FCA46